METEKKKKYVYSTDDMHQLIALTTALQYELKKAEDIRKKIASLRLKKLK